MEKLKKKKQIRVIRKDILKFAKEIYDQQRDPETPPADMEEITEIILMLAKKIKNLELKYKAKK